MIFKNVASQKIRVFAFADAGHASLDPGEPVTGDAAQITARTAVDNATLGASNDVNPAEVDATNAPGYYEFDPTQAETNGDIIEWYAKSSTAGVQVVTVGGAVQMTYPSGFTTSQNIADALKLAPTAGSPASGSVYNLFKRGVVEGTIDTGTFTATTTQFECDDITEATADHYNGRTIVFVTGALAGQAAIITDYSLQGSNGRFTVSRDPDTSVALTEAPGNNDTLIIV